MDLSMYTSAIILALAIAINVGAGLKMIHDGKSGALNFSLAALLFCGLLIALAQLIIASILATA